MKSGSKMSPGSIFISTFLLALIESKETSSDFFFSPPRTNLLFSLVNLVSFRSPRSLKTEEEITKDFFRHFFARKSFSV